MRPQYILIPLAVLTAAIVGSQFTGSGMDWYRTIRKPSFTPPGSFIGVVWTTIYTLTAISMILVCNSGAPTRKTIMIVFAVNLVINAAWSLLFFRLHLIGWAIVDAVAIGITALMMLLIAWPHSRVAALLLVPYVGWTAFATYLNSVIYTMNR